MDCTICLDVKKKISEMEHLECGHSLCIGCFKKLVRNTCPFCRKTGCINNPSRAHYIIKKLNNTIFSCKLCI